MNLSPYGWLMLAGILVSLVFWWWLAPRDRRLPLIYFAALVGALLGAKIIYLAAEGWMVWDYPDKWLRLATGKSILGALIGGYAGVDYAKKYLGYSQITGDWFAIIAPIGIIFGRFGCWSQGCCLGRVRQPAWFTMYQDGVVPRWPAVPVEILFNALILALFLVWRRQQKFPGQHFHIYLIAYGAFRFLHEFLRDTPRFIAALSGYHLTALLVALWGLIAFCRRQPKVTLTPLTP